MSTSTATRRLRAAPPAPGTGRLGTILVASGAVALLGAAAFTVHPGLEAPGQAGAGSAPTTTYVHTLTPEVESGGTARIVTGVAADGALPEGKVELRIGDRVLSRELEVGTATASVQMHEPGTVQVRARYLGTDAADASASEPVTITVR